ncbi:MAG: type II toxin-antitoxin system mRNA interferase toxin, RelE/StbE family [Deltaproteobacteria bacterium HGW-Deltaproteobacteria-13]|nr:MAG: type II toxin-antitoxin system mRNA interferase toxin, RelE/StbE family [Deltaproteobacteria bacterium HGW-Deltaproteobacteria-13]
MLNRFEIAETETFQRSISKKEFVKIYNKIKTYVYPQLRINPFFGNNIKKLKGEFKDVYRYRIGEYRFFYQVDEKQILIFIMDIAKRKDAY